MRQLPLCAYCAQNPVKRKGKKFCSPECGQAAAKGVRRGHVAIVFTECVYCGKEFQAQRSAKRKYCSSECSAMGSSKKKQNTCEVCGKSYLATDQRNIRFCSRKCWRIGCAHQPKTSTCEVCKTDFTQPQTHNRKTCGKKCANILTGQTQLTTTSYTCQQCGMAFTDKACRNRKFCSKQCADASPKEKWGQIGVKFCECCQKPFEIPVNAKAASRQRFCSRKCFSEYKRNQHAPNVCKNCGREFHVIPSQKARPYCSPSCYIEYKTTHIPQRSGDVSLYGLNWYEQRENRRHIDNYRCQHCGVHEGDLSYQLHVHHVVPFREFGIERYEDANQLSNLVSLCSTCHKRLEHKQDIAHLAAIAIFYEIKTFQR